MDADTQIGGTNGAFPDTHSSALRGARSIDPERRTLSYEAIVSAYWKPVYRYIRIKWRTGNEDAKDLTQSFFTLVIDKNFAAGYDPVLASFRTYLRVCLDRFLANQHKYEGRMKRTGELVPLEEQPANIGSVEEAFHREWTRELFARAVEELRIRISEIRFAVFEGYDLAEQHPTYAELAAALNLSAATVTNYLVSARREFRAILYEQLRAITTNEQELRREALALLGP